MFLLFRFDNAHHIAVRGLKSASGFTGGGDSGPKNAALMVAIPKISIAFKNSAAGYSAVGAPIMAQISFSWRKWRPLNGKISGKVVASVLLNGNDGKQ